MRVALDLGADIVNDIAALRTPGAIELVAAHPSCGVCLMHMRGTPRSMQAEAVYDDVAAEVARSCASGSTRRGGGDRPRAHRRRPGHRLRQDAGAEPRAARAPGRAPRARRAAPRRLVAQVDAGPLAGLAAKAPAGRSPAEQARLEAASVVAAVLAVSAARASSASTTSPRRSPAWPLAGVARRR
jgi:hypothetical protein